jgi:hypothetical protein
MSRTMKSEEIDAFEKQFGYKPTEIRVAVDALAVFVHKDNPLEKLTLTEVDAVPPDRRGGPAAIETWVSWPGRPPGEPADQPVRPQLGLRHLRLLQGGNALQG